MHCFEPVPEYFERVQKLAALNPDHAFHVNFCAAGEQPGTMHDLCDARAGAKHVGPADYKTDPEIISTWKCR